MKIPEEVAIAWEKSPGARFYKCALQVNPCTYQAYRGVQPSQEEEYNNQIVEKCRQNKIDVVGLADHGSVQNSEKLRKNLSDAGIVVFPGFEISSSEKVHMVCLFPTDTSESKLNQVLGALQGGAVKDHEKTYPSKRTLLEIAESVFQNKGIWFAAHMEEDNGLLKLHQDGGGLVHIWENDKLVLAGQIKSSIDELDPKYKQIVKNQNADYKRINKISIINAKDIEKPETLDDPKASCLIKMSRPSIEALHQAFLDGESRIRLNTQIPQTYHSRIETISIIGGEFFGEGLFLHLNNNLNAVIGGRGTGKSTLLECIRYGLSAEYHSDDSESRASHVLRSNLGGGKITLVVFSNRFEKKFIIERHLNQPSTIKNEDGTLSNQTIGDILPGLEIFGQNEIFEISENKEYHLQLIERFLPDRSDKHIEVLKQLKSNRQKLIQTREKFDELEGSQKQMDRLQEQQKALQQLGLDKKFKESDIYNIEQKRLLDRTEQDINSITDFMQALSEAIGDIDLQYLSDEAIKDIINKDVFGEIKSHWDILLKGINASQKEINDAIEEFNKKLKETSEKWKQRHTKFREEFDALIHKLPDTGGKKGAQIAKEYGQISQKLASLQIIAKELNNQKKLVDSLEKERKSLLSELDNLLFTRYSEINKTANKLNKNKLAGKLKIVVERNGNKDGLRNFLTSLQGIGARKVSWIDDVEDITIRQLVDDVKKDASFLEEQYSVTPGIALSLSEMGKEKLLELEEVVLKEKIHIELNIGTEEKPRFTDIQHLSSGQRCTAVLHLLMLENRDPLIVDQPEDNLDNAFIAENIVSELRKQKENRQFIFSTHNANIPIFGDAEWIGVMEIKDEISGIDDDAMGSIDKETLKPKVEEILEGGKRAFEIRRLKYGF